MYIYCAKLDIRRVISLNIGCNLAQIALIAQIMIWKSRPQWSQEALL